MRRVIGAMALVVPLAGCGMPTPVSIASFVLDIGSYAVSGKTTTDHAVSALAGEDCAMIRMLEGDPCSSPDDYELALGVLEPLPEAGAEDRELASPTLLIEHQTAALGLADVEPGPDGDFVVAGSGLAGFLSDDAAPGGMRAAGLGALQVGSVGFLSDDARPHRAEGALDG
jgi:hypothetical protein